MQSLLELSAAGYRVIAEWAASTPHWAQIFAIFGTQVLLVVFGALSVLAWWRTQRLPVLFAPPLAAAAGWLLCWLIKEFVQQDRPCRAVPLPSGTVLDCAEVGTWSWPSSHSTAAAAFAVALLMLWPRITALVVLLALLEGFSRIFLGVHYPHDVLAGFALGGVVGLLGAKAALLSRRPAIPVQSG